VRVSLICFGNNETVGRVSGEPRNPPHADAADTQLLLNGLPVARINADLTAGGEDGCDLTSAVSLRENTGASFEGTKKYGDFDITGDLARQWLLHPNPHGKPNSDVVKPWANGQDVTKRPSDTWIIDFGTDMPEPDACLYELPYQYVFEKVKESRKDAKWWMHERPRPEMRKSLRGLTRFIVTPRVAKHRFFVWQDRTVLPDTRLCVIARADDTTFGILGSRIHEVWSLGNASMHGVGNDPTYNAKSCFETFPFPAGLTPADTRSALPPQDSLILPQVAAGHQPAALAIAQAAQRLHALRENWLNPPEWVERVPEVVPGYPDRLLPKAGFEAELKKRTLTNLYNARPAWLAKAHEALDAAVAAAYGWHDYSPAMSDEEILQRLLALNLQRSGKT
jgi:type II restriction/modification system DNA methylase subunit YeeA